MRISQGRNVGRAATISICGPPARCLLRPSLTLFPSCKPTPSHSLNRIQTRASPIPHVSPSHSTSLVAKQLQLSVHLRDPPTKADVKTDQASPPLAMASNDPFYSSAFDHAVESANEGLDLDLEFFNQLTNESDFQSKQPVMPLHPLLTPQHFHAPSQPFGFMMSPHISNVPIRPILPHSPIPPSPLHSNKLDQQFRTASRHAIKVILAAASPHAPTTPIAHNGSEKNIEFAPFASVANHSTTNFNSPQFSTHLYNSLGMSPLQPAPSHGTCLAVPPSPLHINTSSMPSMESLLNHSFLAQMPLGARMVDTVNGFSLDSPSFSNTTTTFKPAFSNITNDHVSDEDGDAPDSAINLGAKSVDNIVPIITSAKTKDGKPLYMCPWDNCGRPFTRQYNLRSHYRQHTGERPFVCNQCPLSFSRQHDLKRHSLIHEGGRQHVCPCCSRAFVRSDALKRHLLPNGDDSKFSKCMQTMRAKAKKCTRIHLKHTHFKSN